MTAQTISEMIEAIDLAQAQFRRRTSVLSDLQFALSILSLLGLWGRQPWLGGSSGLALFSILVLDGLYFFPKAKRSLDRSVQAAMQRIQD